MLETTDRSLATHRPVFRSWQFWLGLVVSLICLGLALREVNFGQVLAIISRVTIGWLALAALSVLVTFVAKALRWRMLFAAGKTPPLGPAFTIQAIGMLVNTFAPARMGDLARAYLMGESEKESKFYVLGTVVIEKLIDLGFLALLVVLLISHMVLPAWLTDSLPGLVGGILIGVFLVGVLVLKGDQLVDWVFSLAARPGWLSRIFAVRWRVRWGEWVAQKAHLGLSSLEVFHRPGRLFGVLAWSLVVWLLSAATDYLVILAIGLRLSFWAGGLLLAVSLVGAAVPSSPGGIGVSEYLSLITLVFLGADKEAALSCGLVLHLVTAGSVGLVGMVCLWREKVAWNKLSEAIAQLRAMLNRSGGSSQSV